MSSRKWLVWLMGVLSIVMILTSPLVNVLVKATVRDVMAQEIEQEPEDGSESIEGVEGVTFVEPTEYQKQIDTVIERSVGLAGTYLEGWESDRQLLESHLINVILLYQSFGIALSLIDPPPESVPSHAALVATADACTHVAKHLEQVYEGDDHKQLTMLKAVRNTTKWKMCHQAQYIVVR